MSKKESNPLPPCKEDAVDDKMDKKWKASKGEIGYILTKDDEEYVCCVVPLESFGSCVKFRARIIGDHNSILDFDRMDLTGITRPELISSLLTLCELAVSESDLAVIKDLVIRIKEGDNGR